MQNLVKDWLKRSEKCHVLANKTQNEMTQQSYLAEAMALEVCADQLKRAIASQQDDIPTIRRVMLCGKCEQPHGMDKPCPTR